MMNKRMEISSVKFYTHIFKTTILVLKFKQNVRMNFVEVSFGYRLIQTSGPLIWKIIILV